jgi:tellurite methyltransferase
MRASDRGRWERRYAARAAQPDVLEAASPFLMEHADQLGEHVLDVAAGAGRNAVFLARRGHRVEAIDISFTALHALRQRAAAEHLSVRVIQADLQMFPLPVARYDAVIDVRYLQRSLFAPMQAALKPGGLILFETFLIDQQAIGHPHNPDFLLRRGELRTGFSHCDILVYEEGLFGGAYLARLLAKTP